MVIGGDDSPQVASSLANSGRFEIVAAREGYEQLVVDKKIGAVLVVPPDFAARAARRARAGLQGNALGRVALVYLGIIFGSTCLYAAGALSLAVKMFNREDVLFRA
jgi:hypothetical protein